MKHKIDFKYNLKEYLGFLKKYRIVAIMLLILILLLEARHVFTKYLFKVIIDEGTNFTSGVLTKAAYLDILIIIAIIYIVLLFFGAIGSWIKLHMNNRLDANLIVDLKRKYFDHILNLSYRFHTSNKTGSLISRLVRSGSAIERLTDVLIFNFIPLVFQLVVVSVSLIYFDWVPALIVFLISVVFISYSFVIQQMQKKSNILALNAEDREKANVSDVFTNIDSIKYFGKEKTINKRFGKLSEITKKAFIKNWDYFRWIDSGQAAILSLGTLTLIYFSILKVLSGDMTIGTLVFIYTVYMGIVGHLFGFVHGIRQYYRTMADFDALFQYGKIENEVKDKPGAEKLIIKNGEIEFKNVSFQYGKRTLFENFNLKIPKGKKVALVGHSGCGKTTLIRLLYRFYDAQLGGIMIDGKSIKDVTKESLRSEMSIVPQEAILFDDTVYNNIAFANPKASREEVMKAIKFAQLDKIIEDFPRKERTIVGERGVKLSGGEKQRVSIARAILANKKILVLDEATSALDSETEHEIQQDLGRLMEKRTSIIIAHRLSTIMKADKIIVMKKGKIVQQGSHNRLINQKGEYKRLWNLQKGGYIK